MIAFLAISDQYSTFIFWMTKIPFDRISRHFRSILNFYFLDDQNPFRSHFSPFQINTQLVIFFKNSQNGCRRPFWMAENHFRSHFSPSNSDQYAIFFLNSQNGCRRPFWMTKNHFRMHFSPFQINTQSFFFFFFFKMAAILEVR